MKKILFAFLAVVCLLFAGCGKTKEAPAARIPAPPTSTPVCTAPAEATAVPTATPEMTAEPSAAPAEAGESVVVYAEPGTYTYQSAEGLWTLTLRDNGPYTLQREGDFPHTGESWAVGDDGTIHCGPTDLWTEAFADGNGCSRWILSPDGHCEPVFLVGKVG